MKRPLFVCCSIMLAALLATELLPQAAFWVPAAFLGCVGLVLFFAKKNTRRAAICIWVGSFCALAIFLHTLYADRIPAETWDGRDVFISAAVSDVGTSYAEGMVSATLRISSADGESVDFKASCSCMPECSAGDIVSGRWQLEKADEGKWRLSRFADGCFMQAEYESDFEVIGTNSSPALTMLYLQSDMSKNIRRYLLPDEGGILAAMTVGDKSYIPDTLQKAYQNAGIPHILVVSGLHLSLLCGLIPLRRRRDSRRIRVFTACSSIAISLFLIGLTGASPSIVRAGTAVILCGVGELLGYPADPLTSLALAGAGLSVWNAYAVFDIAFELSFAATVGVLFAAEELRRYDRYRLAKGGGENGRAASSVRDAAVVSAAAAVCTLPVQVFRGMDISAVSVLTNLLTVWILPPLLIIGFATAFLGFFGNLQWLVRGCALLGGVLVRLMNGIVIAVSRVPHSHLHAETGYPAVVVLLVGAFLAAAAWRKIPKQKAVTAALCLVCLAAAAQGGLSHGLVKIALVGNARVPSVVITQNGEASVLYRGGYYNVQKIEEYLDRENISKIEYLIDFRMAEERECELSAENIISVSELKDGDITTIACGSIKLHLCRMGGGCYAWLQCGKRRVMSVTGTPSNSGSIYPVDFLLATGSGPAQIRPRNILSLTDSYSWLDSTAAERVYYGEQGAALWLRPGSMVSMWNYRLTGVNGWLNTAG